MSNTKAVPVLLRRDDDSVEILAFRHPNAGFQLVKGGIEAGETSQDAALRELGEESGLRDVKFKRDLGTWSSNFEGQTWHFVEVECAIAAPQKWEHFTQDDGGQVFHFFWHPLAAAAGEEWHPVYRAALAELRFRLESQTPVTPATEARSAA